MIEYRTKYFKSMQLAREMPYFTCNQHLNSKVVYLDAFGRPVFGISNNPDH
jgi:hypothetical protein